MNLESMTNVQLVQLYNQKAALLGTKTVNRFADQKTAKRRVAEILAQAAKLESAKPKRKNSRENPRGFNLPLGDNPKEPIEGTLRRRVFDAALKGVTFDNVVQMMLDYDAEVKQPTKNPRGRAYKNIRMLHFYAGYGLRTEGGKIYVVC